MSSVESVISTRIIGETDKMGKIIMYPISSSQPDSICRGCGLECDTEMATENEIRHKGHLTKIKMPCHDKPVCIIIVTPKFNDIYQYIASNA